MRSLHYGLRLGCRGGRETSKLRIEWFFPRYELKCIFTWDRHQEMVILSSSFGLASARGSSQVNKFYCSQGITICSCTWLRRLWVFTFLQTSSEPQNKALHLRKGWLLLTYVTQSRAYFCNLYPQSSCHFLIHSKSLLVPAVALRVLPIYQTKCNTEGEVELPTSGSPWLTLTGIFLPFQLGNLGFLRYVLVWKMTGPKGFGSQYTLHS